MLNPVFAVKILIYLWCLSFKILLIFSARVRVIKYDDSLLIIEGRVHESLDHFMDQPETAAEEFGLFYSYGGFSHDLQAQDRDTALVYMHAHMELHMEAGLGMSYGLENGMYLGYGFSNANSLPVLTYREPGPKYHATSDTREKDLYFNECISDAGESQNCTMHRGDHYVSCINGCDLIKCNGTITQNLNCSAYAPKSTEFAECESSISWCENYEIKKAEGNGEEGYIPLTYYCYDSQGAITDTPGDVLISRSGNEFELGNCVYGVSGAGKLVDRRRYGNFAQCGKDLCNTTYMGGYVSSYYGKCNNLFSIMSQ